MDKRTIREQIVDALRNGFLGGVDRTEDFEDDGVTKTRVYVNGYRNPIIVEPLDVIVPTIEYGPEIASGIMLDVQAILAMNTQGE